MSPRYTVREFLDADLDRLRRSADLETLVDRFTGQPLADTAADLRAALADGIDMEQFRRLHILISHLYHQCGANIPLTNELRNEVGQALARSATTATERGGNHVLSD